MSANLETPVISLPQGQIKGAKTHSIYEQPYYSFEGIPYAKPPLGELRFKAPQPAECWQGVRDCTEFSIKPVQRNPLTRVTEGAEDCLYLNVYAKKLKSDKPLPVMVWIYGGGFVMNSATRDNHSPDYFMSEDVVLVTFNYRLCSLGFLSLSDPTLEVPGNAALKDQVLALKWVHKNISLFNGDPQNVTVFGVSAGGLSTHILTATAQTRGLFQKAIPMAGSMLNPWVSTTQNDFAYRLAKTHGYEDENVDKLVLAFLRQLEPEKLVTHNIPTDAERRNGVQFTFGPAVESYIGADCVIPQPPIEMLKTAWGNDIPMMFGGSSSEGLLLYPQLKAFPQLMKVVQQDPERLLPVVVRQTHTPEENKQLTTQLIRLHFDEEGLHNFLDYYGYSMVWHGVHRSTLSRLHYATAPTYLYRFDVDSPDFNHNRTKFCGKSTVRGTAHADEVAYLFYMSMAWKLEPDSAEFKAIQRMVAIWTAFAKQSDPNCAAIKPNTWQPLDKSNAYKALNISNDVKFLEIPEREKLQIWDGFYKRENLY